MTGQTMLCDSLELNLNVLFLMFLFTFGLFAED
jgi:hypothetical protein